MMFTERSNSILNEIEGLTLQQSKMYILAWKYNKNHLGYYGLCQLWEYEISPYIRLKDVAIVIDRLMVFGFFNTNVCYELLTTNDTSTNDYIPPMIDRRYCL